LRLTPDKGVKFFLQHGELALLCQLCVRANKISFLHIIIPSHVSPGVTEATLITLLA
jgi:hypothetical protein